MATATKSFLVLFTYKCVEESADIDQIVFENVYFPETFGPWKAGDTVEYLGVDFNDCIVYELGGDELDQHIKEVSFRVIPKV